MIEKMKKYINATILASILLFIIGVLVFVFPAMSIKIFTYGIAIITIALGISLIMEDLRLKNFTMLFDFSLVGILLLVIGIIILIYPIKFMNFIPVLLGISFIVNGFMNIKISFLMKESSYFILSIIMSILSIVCGVIFIVNPVFSKEVLACSTGFIIAIYGISTFIDMIIIKKNIKKIEINIKKII